jgi:glutamate-5-semialdehyde dehydrogenase
MHIGVYMNIRVYVEDLAKKAKHASIILRTIPAKRKNQALENVALGLDKNRNSIISANKKDLENGNKAGLSDALLDRLALNEPRIDGMIRSVREIATLEDSVGQIEGIKRPQGFILEKVRVPIGVIAVVYESRPNVTIDAAALCLKSGNAVILRGGSEAIESNRRLTLIIKEALKISGLPEDAVGCIERKEHEGVHWLVKQEGYVDLVIPRGGESLIKKVVDEATVPVIKHYKGVCHLYIDEEADLGMALDVVYNAKVQRPGTCNALETLLVNDKVSEVFLPMVSEKLQRVQLRGCARTRKILPRIDLATEDDYYAEYLDLILAVKVVDSLEDAIWHIETYGSNHTDGIISQNSSKIQKFVEMVDSAVVTVNSSTRLSDGGVFGLGAEIGISTDKLHARGPMGLKDLTSYKWVVRGNGHTRE